VLALVLPLAGRLADRFPSNRVAFAGLVFFALSAVLMGFSPAQTGFWWLALWVALGRIGLGLVIPGLNAGALRLLDLGHEAAGSASINFFRQLGGALGVTLIALFVELRERQLGTVHALQPLQEGFLLVAGIMSWRCLPHGAWCRNGMRGADGCLCDRQLGFHGWGRQGHGSGYYWGHIPNTR